MNTRTRYMVIGAAVIVIIVVVAVILHNTGSNSGLSGNGTSTDQNSSGTIAGPGEVLSSTGQNSVANHSTSSVPIVAAPAITIHLLTPIANNVWTQGEPNPIAWDNAPKITGEIDLVNAVTKKFVGVILSNTGTNQTSYIWDARSIYRARYSADKKDVVPGTYSIRIHFDGNNLGDLISGPITIN